jgi:hypothetical protein
MVVTLLMAVRAGPSRGRVGLGGGGLAQEHQAQGLGHGQVDRREEEALGDAVAAAGLMVAGDARLLDQFEVAEERAPADAQLQHQVRGAVDAAALQHGDQA